jgi:peroxiredoxin Q/BCP
VATKRPQAKTTKKKTAAKKTAPKKTAAPRPAKKASKRAPAAAAKTATKAKAKKPDRGSRPTLPSPSAPSNPGLPDVVAVGDHAPAFSLPDQDGEMVSSDALAGRAYVLYFYPKDDTPGCTREACEFRDDFGKFERAGVRIIGVSPDKPESHVKFRKKYGLGFTLLADTEKELAQAFGVWKMKKNYGREYMGIERSTFFIDASGRIRKAWRGVKVDGHAKAVLGAAG